jgi:excinuclease ABC subunit A
VVIVEHDETCIRNADHIIEMGPEAGKNGGNIVATGSLNNILGNTNSITQQFLKENNLPQAIQRNCKQNSFGIKNAFANNLKQIDVNFISNGIIAITGVSGSGKSSLINEVLLHSAIANKPINCSNIFGLSQFNKIIVANQQAIGNNSLSTPATFTGILDDIRNIFANTVEAKQAGLKKSAFSYHHKDGKCPECNGYGQIRTSMDFMSDIWTTCETCKGNRYNEKVLQIRFKKHTIADILNLTIKEAQTFFSSYPKLSAKLGLCVKTGIGHLQLGQAGNTLSGGESQRLKLASEMIKASSNNNLYLLDEPSTGLHYYDIKHLSILFNELADAGNTIIYIEHNPYLIHLANQVVELGPGSGDEGGTILTKKF